MFVMEAQSVAAERGGQPQPIVREAQTLAVRSGRP